MSEINVRVKKGVAFLDEHAPGWADKIDLDALVMDSNNKCILGQLGGGNGKAFMKKHKLSGKDITDMGFCHFEYNPDRQHELWVKAVQKRVAKKAGKRKVKAAR